MQIIIVFVVVVVVALLLVGVYLGRFTIFKGIVQLMCRLRLTQTLCCTVANKISRNCSIIFFNFSDKSFIVDFYRIAINYCCGDFFFLCSR
jgi:hypothetical protein